MATSSASFRFQVLVIAKTKCRETDLIVTGISPEGKKVSILARGARKPTNSFAPRMELGHVVSGLAIKTKGLPILSEVRADEVFAHTHQHLEANFALQAACELLRDLAQEDLDSPQLFACTRAYLASLDEIARKDSSTASSNQVFLLCVAALIKLISLAGFMPQLHQCALCSQPLDLSQAQGQIKYNIQEGGLVCPVCSADLYGQGMGLSWMSAQAGAVLIHLLYSPFVDLLLQETYRSNLTYADVKDLNHFMQHWLGFYGGHQVKSLKTLFSLVSGV